MVLNLYINAIKVDLILREISGRNPPPLGLLAPLIRITLIDKASGSKRVFSMAFLILYLTSRADFNALRLQKVALNDYA
jgi:hypothetical protein